MKFRPLTEPDDWDWIYSRAKPLQCSDTQGLVAYDERGIQAICVADSFTVDACSVHLAIDNPFVIRSGFFSEIAWHLFITCGRKRIFGRIVSNNEKSINLAKHLGFTEVARIPDWYAEGVDYVAMRMDKENCRWLQEQEAEKCQTIAA